jgi:hypothetical protein
MYIGFSHERSSGKFGACGACFYDFLAADSALTATPKVTDFPRTLFERIVHPIPVYHFTPKV